MIRLVIIFILALFTQVTAATDRECENTADVLGYAAVSFDSTTVLPFFAKADSSEQPVQVLRFFNDAAINSLSFRAEGKDVYSLLRPEMHKLDYSVFELPVRSKHDGWLEVVVDSQTHKTLWARENQTVRFISWLSKMQKAFSVEREDPRTNPIRIEPAGDAKEVKPNGKDCFKVNQMRGNWIKVVQQNHCDGSPRSLVSGWIRWRDEKGCLLVSIYPFA